MSFKDRLKRIIPTFRRDYILESNAVPPLSLSISERVQSDILTRANPYTMTSEARQSALLKAVCHVVTNGIEGSFVECGVWKGGSMLIVALVLKELGIDTRELYLFDTYAGMVKPSEQDIDAFDIEASVQFEKENGDETGSEWCRAGLETVKETMGMSNYPNDKVNYIVGDVRQTLPDNAPDKIALLRLDTDWYESTRHELETLFSRVSKGGILIIDDYGHWQGAKKAVHEYFSDNRIPIDLYQIDYSGRLAIV